MPKQRQKWSRPLQVTGIKNFDLVELGITVSFPRATGMGTENGPTYGSANGADQEMPVFNDVQVCYRIGRSGKHIAK